MDAAAVYNEAILAGFDLALKPAVVSVVFKEVGVCFNVEKVIDRHNLEVLSVSFQNGL